MRTVGDRLSAARRRGFVGRTREIELFERLVRGVGDTVATGDGSQGADPDADVAVLFVHGPAGVGKSALLRRFADAAQSLGAPCRRYDARDLTPSPEGLAPLLARGDTPEGSNGPDDATDDSLAPHARPVLLLDTFELLAGVEDWFRESLLPELPGDTLVVLAGQYPPGSSWIADPGWSQLVRAIPLENLSAADSEAFLAARDVAEGDRPAAVRFTRGHPFALALVSEVIRSQGGGFTPHQSPDVIKVLVDDLVEAVPSPGHRHALEAAAQVRLLTEPLLAAMLGTADGSLFAWLRGLPVTDSGVGGLYLHDLARDVLDADLRWRDPERHASLHRAAREYYLSRLESTDAAVQSTALRDLIFLHQELRPYLQPSPTDADGALRLEPANPAREEDVEAICGIVATHEGEESAAYARAWLARQPRAFSVVRDAAGTGVRGLVCALALDDPTAPGERATDPSSGASIRPSTDPSTDPAVVAAQRQLRAMPPVRAGERVTLFRWWMAADTYQDVSPVQSLLAVHMGRHYLTTPGLAVTLLPFADPDAWGPVTRYADQHRMPAADFTVGGRTYGVFGHDWRVVTPAAWLTTLAVRETGAGGPAAASDDLPEPSRPSATVSVLAREEFAPAVRRALRGLTRPDQLRGNPLLASRLVGSRAGDAAPTRARVQALQEVLREACQAFESDRRVYRVLHRSFLAPAPTLEAAADALAMPSSTFRRHLRAAEDRVIDVLWERELGG